MKPAAVTKIFSAGNITQTGNELDLAIQGDGFFQVQQSDGSIAYTRAGAMKARVCERGCSGAEGERQHAGAGRELLTH